MVVVVVVDDDDECDVVVILDDVLGEDDGDVGQCVVASFPVNLPVASWGTCVSGDTGTWAT